MKSLVSILFTCLACYASTAIAVCSQPDNSVLASIVRVAGDDGSNGSGVVVAKNRVLTAAHVINEAKSVYIGFGGSFREANILLIDGKNDIALLDTNTAHLAPIPLSRRSPQPNEQVWAIGYPLAQDLVTTSGVLDQLVGRDLHTTAGINSGQSGGGLISCQAGRHVVAGMLRGFGAYLEGDHYVRLENHSVSVAASDIKVLMDASSHLHSEYEHAHN